MVAEFVHLNLHSEYSVSDGLIRIKPLIASVAELDMPAVAITDQHNLFAAVKFYSAAIGAGVKPILGAAVRLRDEISPNKTRKFILLCQNNAGYRNLSRLLSQAYIEGQHQGVPTLSQAWLMGQTEGLICLSGGREGILGSAILSNTEEVDAISQQWQDLFPDRLYLELMRTGRSDEEAYIQSALDLAVKHDLPVVATNDVRFETANDFEAHEARVCISEGRVLDDPRRERRYSEQQYLRDADEMAELFIDIPEAIQNTIEIAKRCNVELDLGNNYLPDFPIPAGLTAQQFLSQESEIGLAQRLVQLYPDEQKRAEVTAEYDVRLIFELDVINSMGFPGYFLIVADFIRWSRENGIPVGPGRGSGAGSLVAYSLGITDLDPLEYELLFERFLNPERVSLPDFDVDFCMVGRDRVITYVTEQYGHDHVSQIITYGTMAAKAVLRDAGRVLGMPYGLVDGLAKLVPFDLKITIEKALVDEPLLKAQYDNEEEVKTLIDLAMQLEGLTRNVGRHAAGVVIAPKALTEYTPLYCEKNGSELVAQYDKDDVERVGLVKFDFLGLKTLTVIDWAVKNVQSLSETPLDWDINNMSVDDAATYELLKRAETTAVFQLESSGMKELIKRLKPDNFEEIIALVALYRPGPLNSGMADDFVDRKHGRSAVDYMHPSLEEVLKPTYGTVIYQEQVMQIAQELSGYTLGGADMLRRAMGKKKAEEMAEQRSLFVDGAVANDVDEKLAASIFDKLEKFAQYGFNKSHSAAYALIAYQTAWLKTHHPAAFMAAVLSVEMDNTEKVVGLIDECRTMGLKVLPPDVNFSSLHFTAQDPQTIRYGLGAIKGVGEAALLGVIAEREQQGNYTDLFNFCRRVDTSKVNKRVLEALARSGGLDSLASGEGKRARLVASLAHAVHIAEQQRRDSESGQGDMFGVVAPTTEVHEELTAATRWTEAALLAAEKETLGLYLSGHPINAYDTELRQFIPNRLNMLDFKGITNSTSRQGKNITVAGLIVAVRTIQRKQGGRLAFVTLDDNSARLEIRIFSKVYEQYHTQIQPDHLVIVQGRAALDNFSGEVQVTADNLFDITRARELYGKSLLITVEIQRMPEWIEILQDTLEPHCSGVIPVDLCYQNSLASGVLRLGDEWQITPSETLIEKLQSLEMVSDVRMQY